MTIDPRDRFSAGAGLYQRYRPDYPDALLAWIAAETGVAPPARVVDLGCGTGISSRFFARHGFVVTGVEPNPDMLARAVAAGGGPTYVRGDAERTGLPDGAAELAVAAQAFHWFDGDAALREIDRLLAPGGWACAFWNLRDASALDTEYEAILLRRSAEYRATRARADVLEAALARAGRRRTQTSLRRVDHLDWERFAGRVHSASYVLHGLDDRQAFDAELRALFDRHAAGGVVDLPMRTDATVWPRGAT